MDTLSKSNVIYFSKIKGHQEFLDKIELSQTIKDDVQPKVLLDKRINGPWDKFTTVWRVVFNCSSLIHSKEVNVFKF